MAEDVVEGFVEGADVVEGFVEGAEVLLAGATVDDRNFDHFVRRRILSKKSGTCLVSFRWQFLLSGLNLQKILDFQASKSPTLLLIFFCKLFSGSTNELSNSRSLEPSDLAVLEPNSSQPRLPRTFFCFSPLVSFSKDKSDEMGTSFNREAGADSTSENFWRSSSRFMGALLSHLRGCSL